MTNRVRVLAGSIQVGDFITTNKRNDVWWKVESITEQKDGWRLLSLELHVVNKLGYQKTFYDNSGSGRKFYRWTRTEN